MSLVRQRWKLLVADPARVAALAAELDLHPLVARILIHRGHADAAAARAFLRPPLAAMGEPYAMADAERAAERLARAVLGREAICIYGDYDVDGVSAAALLHSFLGSVGARPRVFVPDRFKDGYGLSRGRLRELCAAGIELFVAVDCGVTAFEAIAEVRARGRDFIVCDHHAPGPELPPANAVMNPRRADCGYPDDGLAAVGVALVLARATRRKLAAAGLFDRAPFGGRPVSLGGLVEFAALGTIADMVPLRGINRALAWHGLRALGRSRRPGVIALARRAGLDGSPRAEYVGFRLGPRINAAGRVADARTAFELLTTEDPEHAERLAERVDLENNRRRVIQRQVTAAALATAREQPGREHAVVVAQQGWHAGVVGIVAAHLKDRFEVPAFVLSIDGETARGSGRSVPGYGLVAGLRAIASEAGLQRYGGHDFAAGVTLPAAAVDSFRAALVGHVERNLPLPARSRSVPINAEVEVGAIDLAMVDALDCLEPFGRGNPRPALLLRDVVVSGKRLVGQDERWCRLRLVERSDRPLWARRGADLFCRAERVADLEDGDAVSAVVKLGRNTYRGHTDVQLTPVAFGPPDIAVQEVAPPPPGASPQTLAPPREAERRSAPPPPTLPREGPRRRDEAGPAAGAVRGREWTGSDDRS